LELPVIAPGPRNRIVCLLPVRNGAADLPGYFDSVGRFADAVVALDDGSSDDTRARLESEPLVKLILTNEPRNTHAGWDDAGNRTRLLNAAGALDPEWVLWLDADERIDAADGAALRRFVEHEAVPDYAYLMKVLRMVGDEHVPGGLWVGRLFAYQPARRLGEKLHLVPIPESIPRDRWLRTTIRIQHLGSSTPERNRARYEKYREADPEGHRAGIYEPLLRHDDTIIPWEKRAPDLPVLLDPAPVRHSEKDIFRVDLEAPTLSAVVIARDDEATIERTVRSVVEQECPVPFEVIVVVSGTDRTARFVREEFPSVNVIELGNIALPGAARNAGLFAARGDYVSFPGSHVVLPPGSLAARIRAHERGFPMVTGSVINGTTTRSGWASYFLDHSSALPGRPSGALKGPPAHCSYDREILLSIGGFPQDVRAGEDTEVNLMLHRRGYRAVREQEIKLVHRSPCRNPLALTRHHFTRGRAWGRILRQQDVPAARSLLGYVSRRLNSTTLNVAEWGGDLEPLYRRVRALVVLGVTAAWVGCLYEIAVGGLLRRSARNARETTLRSRRPRPGEDEPGTDRSLPARAGKRRSAS
jgi:glycosyltransferase involved in cell wall biosynthesis